MRFSFHHHGFKRLLLDCRKSEIERIYLYILSFSSIANFLYFFHFFKAVKHWDFAAIASILIDSYVFLFVWVPLSLFWSSNFRKKRNIAKIIWSPCNQIGHRTHTPFARVNVRMYKAKMCLSTTPPIDSMIAAWRPSLTCQT